MADDLVIVAEFNPPDAQGHYASWRLRNEALLKALPGEHVRIDLGRAEGGGDFVRVWLPARVADRTVA
jgi:hypothetical protein